MIYRNILVLGIIALEFNVQAFITAPLSNVRAFDVRAHRADRTANALFARPTKKPELVEKTKDGPDYGKIAVMLINPLNPYAWFLYAFVGINLYSVLNP